jgi:hypothetical protein
VLALVAEGRSNDDNRRVLAVLAYLGSRRDEGRGTGVPPGSAGEIAGCGRVELTSWRRILRLLALDRGTDGDQ